jgi:hypothetical protein
MLHNSFSYQEETNKIEMSILHNNNLAYKHFNRMFQLVRSSNTSNRDITHYSGIRMLANGRFFNVKIPFYHFSVSILNSFGGFSDNANSYQKQQFELF